MQTQRRQLTGFLKTCRARISPTEAGLPDTSRRRTPGLRREDVAALAGMSVTWYTWLEQGREVRASADVLEKIATALRMSPDEREYLFALVQHRPAPYLADEGERVSPEIRRMLDDLNLPAFVMTWRWDVVAWNQLAATVFRDYSKLDPRDRNLIRFILLDPQYRVDPREHEETVSRVLARFRLEYSHTPNDERMNALIKELSENCPDFERLWVRSIEVSTRFHGIVTRHAKYGRLTFEHTSYVPEGSPKLRLCIFAPHDDATRRRIAALNRDLTTQRAKEALN